MGTVYDEKAACIVLTEWRPVWTGENPEILAAQAGKFTWPNLHTAVIALNPAHAHTVRKYKVGNQTFWCVEGPDGYFRGGYHHEAEAAAVAAFWSGDSKTAEEHRKAFLVQRGLIQEEA